MQDNRDKEICRDRVQKKKERRKKKWPSCLRRVSEAIAGSNPARGMDVFIVCVVQ